MGYHDLHSGLAVNLNDKYIIDELDAAHVCLGLEMQIELNIGTLSNFSNWQDCRCYTNTHVLIAQYMPVLVSTSSQETKYFNAFVKNPHGLTRDVSPEFRAAQKIIGDTNIIIYDGGYVVCSFSFEAGDITPKRRTLQKAKTVLNNIHNIEYLQKEVEN